MAVKFGLAGVKSYKAPKKSKKKMTFGGRLIKKLEEQAYKTPLFKKK